MKNLFKSSLAILIGLSLTMSSCKKDDSSENNGSNNNGTTPLTIPQVQKSTVIYFGGTWCPPCGAYGKPAKEQIKSTVGDKCTIVSCQVGNDPMKNADADAVSAIFNPSGVPAMYIGANDAPIVAMIGGSTATGTTAIGHVNTQSAKVANIATVLSIKEAEGLVNVTANVKYFVEPTGGEYYISGYLLEDKLNHAQVSDGSKEKNIHYNVLRSKFGTSAYGEIIKTGAKKDDIVKKELNFFIQPTFVKENLSVVVIIWKKDTAGKLTISNSEVIRLVK